MILPQGSECSLLPYAMERAKKLCKTNQCECYYNFRNCSKNVLRWELNGFKKRFLVTKYERHTLHAVWPEIGRFFKVLGNKISSKRSPKLLATFGLFWKTLFFRKNCIGYFWATFGKIGLLFTPTSGHTGIGTKKSFAKIKILFLLLVGVREGELGR